MKIAINQPTYFPWMGYFDLIDHVDLFVVLDSVQFTKQSWQQRNRIKTAAGLQWLTVPVEFRGRFGQAIKDVEIREPEFHRNHLRAIELAYRRSPHFDRYFSTLRQRLQELCTGLLANLNMGLISWAMEILGINTRTVLASSLAVEGKRTDLLAEICCKFGASEYISPIGSSAYLLAEQDVLHARGVEILFQNYEHPTYPQLFPPFEPFASVLDLIFNCGPSAADILRSGRRELYSVDQLPHHVSAEAQGSSALRGTSSLPITSLP